MAIGKMGQSYRQLAAQMSVTSTEIAEAAVEFWRQGLDETEVNSRLKATTQYAKISAMAFDESAELVTAATNTMEIGAQRVVDVFAYLGDASASGADEIGVAMQKASASAKEFGISFEWLGAYIATISEKTRQAPEVIGTSLNSIMARLHSIKAKGFNEEDATRINDIAKALGTLDKPIKLIDEATGKWRDMSIVFEELARQWSTLDAKQRAYISTTMAGTRQQNYFLALMDDMSRVTEGQSRAFQLYEGAMTSAGTAAGKYAVWQESVTAAQNRLTAAMQNFYALLNAEWMKAFYNGMADIVNILTAGTDAMNGWNIIIPIAAAAITALIAVTYKAVVAFKALQAAMAAGQGAATVLSGGTIAAIGAALGVIALLVTSVVGAASAASEVKTVDYSGTVSSVTSYRENIAMLTGELET